ncbi:MAG: thioredoxin family protein [Leeuwenhoekiella sp.]
MKTILLFFLLLGNTLLAQVGDQSIQWITWQELETTLEEEPKKTLLFFEANWCAYCKKIDRVVFTKPEVIQKINSEFYAVRMDVETLEMIDFDGVSFTNTQSKTMRNGIHDLALLFASREGQPFSLPVTVILDADFKIEHRIFEYYSSSELLRYID